MKKTLIIIHCILFFSQFSIGQIDTVKFKRHFSYGFELGYSASRWAGGPETNFAIQSDQMFNYTNHSILLGGIFNYKPAKLIFSLESGVLLQEKIDILYCVIPLNVKIYMFQRHKINFFIKFGINNDIGIVASTDKFGKAIDGNISRYDFGINYGIGLRFNFKNNKKGELWLRTSKGFGVSQETEGSPRNADYYSIGIQTLEFGINYQIFNK